MVLVSCSYIPLEIPLALGMAAKRAVFSGLGASCEAYLPRDFCPYARALAREHGQDCVVAVAGSCDGMRRAYDALRHFRLARTVHFVDVPRSCEGGADVYYAEVLRAFARELAPASRRESAGPQGSLCDVDGPLFLRRLTAVIQSMNSLRQELTRLFELVADGRMSAVDAVEAALRVNDALGGGCTVAGRGGASSGPAGTGAAPGGECEGFDEAAREAVAALCCATRFAGGGRYGQDPDRRVGDCRSSKSGRAGGKVRVGVSGTCLLEPALLGALEDAGMSVAFVDSCLGLRGFDFRVPANERPCDTEGDLTTGAAGAGAAPQRGEVPGAIPGGELDPFHALARAYLAKPACPRMFVGTARAEHLRKLARSCRANGVVYVAPKFCDHAYYDFAELKRDVGEGGRLPMLLLEVEYGSARSGQIVTRMTAFREMLEGRVGNA